MILSKPISVKRVKSTTRNKNGDVRVYDSSTEIRSGEEVKQFGAVDLRGDVFIRWNGHTYLTRQSDLAQKTVPEVKE